jgi:hypothetical protein
MPKKIFLKSSFLIFISCALIGCLGNYPTTTTSNINKKTKEEKVQEAVSNHVTSTFEKIGKYKNYQFGDLVMYKPIEIKELDALIDVKNKLPLQENLSNEMLDSALNAQEVKIAYKKQEIQDKHIYPWFEINHIFTISPLAGDSVNVYQYDFEVYPNYTIKDAHQNMLLRLRKTEYATFDYFFNQLPVYESENYSWANDMNDLFYAQCLAALENEDEYKGELLRTILKMTDYIRMHNDFDEGDFTKNVALDWEKENIENPGKKINFKELTPVIENIENIDVIVGYQLIHELSENQQLIFIFDLNFVLTSVKN